jgi:hypothetical protein
MGTRTADVEQDILNQLADLAKRHEAATETIASALIAISNIEYRTGVLLDRLNDLRKLRRATP